MTDAVDQLTNSFRCLSLSERDPVEWMIPNIHRDDIHGLILIGGSHIVSGSKDGSIVKATTTGRIVSRVDPDNGRIDYRRWLTAITRLDDTSWAQGTRDGQVYVRDNDLKIVHSWTVYENASHVCKERNASRIMSFGVPSQASTCQHFFVGQATQFSLFSKQGQEIGRYQADPNDWVYVIHQLSKKRMLVVTGTNMALWKKDHGWQQDSFVVEDKRRFQDGHRPYISSLIPLANDTSRIAYTVFDGSVRVLDLTTQRPVIEWREHQNRVWSVVTCCHSLLASSADDGTVKLWDTRFRNSVCTFSGHSGRVSSLLSLDTHLVCASCPNRPSPQNGASLICRDIRGF